MKTESEIHETCRQVKISHAGAMIKI